MPALVLRLKRPICHYWMKDVAFIGNTVVKVFGCHEAQYSEYLIWQYNTFTSCSSSSSSRYKPLVEK
jgi:hypothetical protein